jgi:hypothetical protein
MILITADTLVEEVRSLTNELNQDSLQTVRDILPALNRAQEHMMAILAKHYPEPYLKEAEFTVSNGQSKYSIPEDAWSDQVTKIEMLAPNKNYRYEVERAAYRDATKFRADSRPNTPYYYIIHGRFVEFIPAPSGAYDATMWYLRAPERLVLQQGRITHIDAANNRIQVDAIGGDLSTTVDNLASWINIIDGQTGEVKATAQIKSTTGTQNITFKSNTDDTILNRTVTKDLTTVLDIDGNLNIQKNDYICSVEGTCVPYFFQPAKNFIVSHAAADCGRAIGVPSESMYAERDKFEKEIKDTWTGREASIKIKNNSPHWALQRYVGRYRR